MRICFSTTGDVRATATLKRALGMAAPLRARAHDVGLMIWDTPANRERIARECPGVDTLWIPAGASPLAELRLKRRLLAQWRPDLVYVCAYGLRNLFTRGAAGGGAVIIEHSELASAIPDMRQRQLWEWLVEALSVRGADGLLCASRYLENLYRRRARAWGRRQLPVLYHPYAYTAGPADPVRVAEIRMLGSGRAVMLYMGTLVANYGVFEMLDATARLASQREDFVLHVLGHGRHASQARQRAAELGLSGRVNFHGYVPEESLSAWFQAADVFLAPIHSTVQDLARCPSKLYMYLPSRKPIVTSRLGDPGDLLGEDGFYHEAGNAASMAEALARALDASANWKPLTVRPEAHSWEARTDEFLAWVSAQGLKGGIPCMA